MCLGLQLLDRWQSRAPADGTEENERVFHFNSLKMEHPFHFKTVANPGQWPSSQECYAVHMTHTCIHPYIISTSSTQYRGTTAAKPMQPTECPSPLRTRLRCQIMCSTVHTLGLHTAPALIHGRHHRPQWPAQGFLLCPSNHYVYRISDQFCQAIDRLFDHFHHPQRPAL